MDWSSQPVLGYRINPERENISLIFLPTRPIDLTRQPTLRLRRMAGSVRISVCEAWSVSPTIGRETVSDGRSRRQGRDAPDCSLVRSRCLFLRPDLPSSWRPRPAVSNPPSSAGPEPRAAPAWGRAWRGPTIWHGQARPPCWTQVAMAARSVTAVTKRGPHSRDAVQVEIDDLLKRLRCGTGAQTFR